MGKMLGIDIGGTFTDGILIDEKGEVLVKKAPSTPEDQSIGVMDCWNKLQIRPEELDIFIHGSTIATNCIIERTGPRIALVTTRGARDVLEFHRADRGDPFNIQWVMPKTVVVRRDIFEVTERLRYDGSVKIPFDEADARRVAQIIKERDYPAVAVVFIHSYRNDSHEKRMKEIILEKNPNIHVSISSEVLPQYREFERTSTTASNAYLVPVVRKYLDGLESRVRKTGYKGGLLLIQTSGGLITLDACKEIPGKVLMSGPAGGAVAASHFAKLSGFKDVISLDMGGTSTDICLIINGASRWTHEQQFSWGVPIRFPSLDLVTCGAGGGSIAWRDELARVIKVGPRSAGSNPGPACYDRGGTEPTTTDAQVILGRLHPDKFLGGEMKVKPELSLKAIKEKIADPFGMNVYEAAKGILQVNIDNTMRAMRLATIERGHDPRDFAFLVFGGGGPLYGCELAKELAIGKVIVPTAPGALSAMGMLFADQRYDAAQTVLVRQRDIDLKAVEKGYKELEKRLDSMLEEAGIPRARRSFERFADMRYAEQGFELTVPVDGNHFDEKSLQALIERFHQQHQKGYNYHDKSISIEIVTIRAFGIGQMPSPELRKYPLGPADTSPAKIDARKVYFLDQDRPLDTTIYSRSLLKAGNKFSGPAIVEQMDTTTLLYPGMDAEVDEFLNIIITTNVKRDEIRWKSDIGKLEYDSAIYSSRRA